MGEAARQTLLIQEILQSFSCYDHSASFINLFMVPGTRLVAINSYHYKNTQNQPNFCFLPVPHSISTGFRFEGFIHHYVAAFHSCRVFVLVFPRLVVSVRLSRSIEQPCHMGSVI